jgi:hypothetical protein
MRKNYYFGNTTMLLELRPSSRKNKKLAAIFDDHPPVHFGGKGYMDYLLYKQKEGLAVAKQRRELYLNRHGKKEAWANPYLPGTLSRYILWEFHPRSAVRKYNELFFKN